MTGEHRGVQSHEEEKKRSPRDAEIRLPTGRVFARRLKKGPAEQGDKKKKSEEEGVSPCSCRSEGKKQAMRPKHGDHVGGPRHKRGEPLSMKKVSLRKRRKGQRERGGGAARKGRGRGACVGTSHSFLRRGAFLLSPRSAAVPGRLERWKAFLPDPGKP